MKTSRTPEWELLLATFMFTLTVLFGGAYVIAWNYQLPIPWLLLLLLSLIITVVGSILRRKHKT